MTLSLYVLYKVNCCLCVLVIAEHINLLNNSKYLLLISFKCPIAILAHVSLVTAEKLLDCLVYFVIKIGLVCPIAEIWFMDIGIPIYLASF